MLFLSVDIISAIEFDKTGNRLATGDKGGRVVLFERTDNKEVLSTLHSVELFNFYTVYLESQNCSFQMAMRWFESLHRSAWKSKRFRESRLPYQQAPWISLQIRVPKPWTRGNFLELSKVEGLKNLFLLLFIHFQSLISSFSIQFDYLKSLEIEEKINKIKWCPSATGASSLLSTNDKTIKYWKVCGCLC